MIVAFFMAKTLRALSLFAVAACACAAVPAPKEHFGFTPGDDYKLADSKQIFGYFERLARASDRIHWERFGTSSEGRPLFVAFISAPENLRRLDRYRQISRRLALGQASATEARQLAAGGKVIVWIDSGLHATEVAPAQQSPELAYRLLTDESDETAAIRHNVILMQVPVINPDGLDMVAGWYAKNVGTPYQTAPLPWLYQKYSGHDNNRDWFMLNLPETRHVTRLLYRQWFPQIVYNQHQTPAFPARIFVPPYADPLNPNIPAAVMEGINALGMAIKERLARENKPGVLSVFGFDAWWNGGLRSAPAFHNMHGILTETAGFSYATPREYRPDEIPATFAGGISTREPSMFYERPWTGGWWRLRDAIEYMLTVDFAILNLASLRRSDYLLKSWQMARSAIESGEKGNPFAYLIPPAQEVSLEMAERLSLAGVEIRRQPDGTIVIPAAQPFRPYLVDLMEPQKYPSAAKRPYDVAGWTLPMLMGVTVNRAEASFDLSATEPCDASCLAALRKPAPATRAAHARLAIYEPWTANADCGWTQWTFDYHKIPYALLHNEDLRQPGLESKFDAIILAAQSLNSILNGARDGEISTREGAPTDISVQRPEYAGGIGIEGLLRLDQFVRAGGTLIALDTASDLPIQFFPLAVRNVGRSAGFSCPGSLLRVAVDTSHPIAAGMPKEITVFSTGESGFEVTLAPAYNRADREIKTVVSFASANLLASGWISSERVLAGKPALVEARHGRGRVVLFGFRPQFRGQTFGTFRLLLNAVETAAEKK